MNNAATKPLLGMTNPSQIGEPAAWLAILATVATLLLLASRGEHPTGQNI